MLFNHAVNASSATKPNQIPRGRHGLNGPAVVLLAVLERDNDLVIVYVMELL